MSLYDVQQYGLAIKFDLSRKVFEGSVTVRAQALQALDTFVLSASSKTLHIDSVMVGRATAAYRHENSHVVIPLPVKLQSQQAFEAQVFYHGTSGFRGTYDDGGVYFPDSTEAYRLATISEPRFARTWFPCKDVPSDKATASVTVTVPDSLTAVSNGILKKTERDDSTATYFWETGYPIATYLISIAAAPYHVFSDTYTGLHGEQMPVQYYVYPRDSVNAKHDFQNTTKILNFFARTFCEYPFIKEKYGYAEVEGDLTMENQTICSVQSTLITGTQSSELTLVHETAHQWWGDMISPSDWHHTWLNEGFAQYAEALYLENMKGRPEYQSYIGRMLNSQNGILAGSVTGQSDTAFWDSFSPRVYVKGALVLHMLRGIVGDSAFFTIMRNYLNNPRLRYAGAQTSDFIQECEQVYGRSLQWFFDEWVFASVDSVDRPVYECTWKSSQSESSYSVELVINQKTAPKLLYRMPLSVSVSTEDSTFMFAVLDSLPKQTFKFTVPGKPETVRIDKENNVLKSLTLKEEH